MRRGRVAPPRTVLGILPSPEPNVLRGAAFGHHGHEERNLSSWTARCLPRRALSTPGAWLWEECRAVRVPSSRVRTLQPSTTAGSPILPFCFCRDSGVGADGPHRHRSSRGRIRPGRRSRAAVRTAVRGLWPFVFPLSPSRRGHSRFPHGDRCHGYAYLTRLPRIFDVPLAVHPTFRYSASAFNVHHRFDKFPAGRVWYFNLFASVRACRSAFSTFSASSASFGALSSSSRPAPRVVVLESHAGWIGYFPRSRGCETLTGTPLGATPVAPWTEAVGLLKRAVLQSRRIRPSARSGLMPPTSWEAKFFWTSEHPHPTIPARVL